MYSNKNVSFYVRFKVPFTFLEVQKVYKKASVHDTGYYCERTNYYIQDYYVMAASRYIFWP